MYPSEDATVVDEETPLLAPSVSSSSVGSAATLGKPRPTPLPKLQIGILLAYMMAEPMTAFCILPFINQLVSELDIVKGDKRKVGYYAGIIESLFFATETVAVMHWARLSDRVGRKPVLLFGVFGLAISMLAFGLSRTFWKLVLSRCIAGALNGNAGVVKSAIGEMTDSSNLAQAFAFMPIVWGTGLTIAPLIGGTLSRPYDNFPNTFSHPFWRAYPYFLPCLMSAAYCFCIFIISVFFQKTTKAPSRRKSNVKQASTGSTEERVSGDCCAAARTPEPTKPKPKAPIPYRALLVRPVLVSTANYAALSTVEISFTALQPLFLATPVALGGLGFSPAKIGVTLGAFGLVNGLLQSVLFARVVGRCGLRTVFAAGIAAFLPMFALFPMMSAVARGYGVNFGVWALLVLQLVLLGVMDMAWGAINMFITSSAPNKRSLGSTNGFAQIAASLSRTVGPASATALFALSKEKNLLGGNLVYCVFFVAAIFALYIASLLPPEAWNSDKGDDSDDE